MKRIILSLLVLILIGVFASAESMYSPTWGFFLDLPEGYEFTDGDGKDRFSFTGPAGLKFDLVVYDGRYKSIQDMADNVNKNISNKGDTDFFTYYDKKAALMILQFDNYTGIGLCIELAKPGAMMVALAYCSSDQKDLDIFHFSALDSIAPSVAERLCPGPIMHSSYLRGELKNVTLAGGIPAMIYENDAELAQIFIEREYALLTAYINTDYVYKAWYRYYRVIFRDSFDRIVNPAFTLANAWGGTTAATPEAKRTFAQRALHFVQGFQEENNTTPSDLINPVTAITERRGDCDSRSMVWAIILTCAEIRAGMLVSRHYSHALGMADIEGIGTRIEVFGVHWLVAETMTNYDLGVIAKDISDGQYWMGIVFE